MGQNMNEALAGDPSTKALQKKLKEMGFKSSKSRAMPGYDTLYTMKRGLDEEVTVYKKPSQDEYKAGVNSKNKDQTFSMTSQTVKKVDKFFHESGMNEAYKVHYPTLKNLTRLQYTDPRVATDGRSICVEKEGNFRKGDVNIPGHYVVYEDKGMPGSFIAVHISSEMNEESGEAAQISVIALDSSKSTVVNRVSYRMRQSKIVEMDNLEEMEKFSVTGKDLSLVKKFAKQINMDWKTVAARPAWTNVVLPFLQKNDMKGAVMAFTVMDGWDRTQTGGINIEEAKAKTPRIDAMRKIVKDHQHAKIEGQLVDAFSASAYVQVYDALKPASREQMEGFSITKAMGIVWKLIK